MKNLNKQKGFTLIELVVVIVILGILAVTAAPKFIDISGDARESVMESVKGSIESAVSMVHAKAIIQNKLGQDDEIVINNEYYALVYGYPSAKGKGTPAGTTGNGWGIVQLIDASAEIIKKDEDPAIFQHSEATKVEECQLSYAKAANKDTRPFITETFTDC